MDSKNHSYKFLSIYNIMYKFWSSKGCYATTWFPAKNNSEVTLYRFKSKPWSTLDQFWTWSRTQYSKWLYMLQIILVIWHLLKFFVLVAMKIFLFLIRLLSYNKRNAFWWLEFRRTSADPKGNIPVWLMTTSGWWPETIQIKMPTISFSWVQNYLLNIMPRCIYTSIDMGTTLLEGSAVLQPTRKKFTTFWEMKQRFPVSSSILLMSRNFYHFKSEYSLRMTN